MVVFLVVISLAEFYIPLRFSKVVDMPQVFEYLSVQLPPTAKLVAYPPNSANQMLFWLHKYEKTFLNPYNLDLFYPAIDRAFLKASLNTCEGLTASLNKGATHLVYFYNLDHREAEPFFGNSPMLEKLYQFDVSQDSTSETRTPFYVVHDTIESPGTAAVVYQLNKGNCLR